MNNQIETRFTRDYKVQYPIGLASARPRAAGPFAVVREAPDPH